MNYIVLFFIALLVIMNLTFLLNLKRKNIQITPKIMKETLMNIVPFFLGSYLGLYVLYYAISMETEIDLQFLFVASIGGVILIYETFLSFYEYYLGLIEKE